MFMQLGASTKSQAQRFEATSAVIPTSALDASNHPKRLGVEAPAHSPAAQNVSALSVPGWSQTDGSTVQHDAQPGQDMQHQSTAGRKNDITDANIVVRTNERSVNGSGEFHISPEGTRLSEFYITPILSTDT